MNTFITKLENQTGLDLSALHLGVGKQGMAFAADLDGEVPSIAGLLSALGLEVPNEGNGIKHCRVQIALGYEARRGSTDYQTVAKVTLIGPLQLRDLFEGIDIPPEIIPEVDKIQLRFEADKIGKGTTATTSIEIQFELSYTLSTGQGPNILSGVYQHFTQGSNEVNGIAGGIHSAGNPFAGLNLDIGHLLDVHLTQPFFIHLKDNTDDITLIGTSIDLSAGLPIPQDSPLHDYLAKGTVNIKHGLAMFSSAVLSKSAETWANELLRNVGIAPLPLTSSIGTYTSISKGLNITGYSDFTHSLSIEDWIGSWLKNHIASGVMDGIDKLFPSLSITELFFGYHEGSSISMGAKAILTLKNGQYTKLPLEFRAIEGKTGWTIESKTMFASPLPLNELLNDLLGSLDLGCPFHSMGLDVVSMDVTYGITDKTIGFGLGLDKAGAPAKLNQDKTDSFFVQVYKSSTLLELQLRDGMNLGQLLGFVDPLFGLEDITLESVKFKIPLADVKSTETNYSFSTTFKQGDDTFNIAGALDKHTTGSSSTSLMGLRISSPSGAALSLNGLPLTLSIKEFFLASLVSDNAPASILFHADLNLGLDLDLSTLPVLGKFLSEAQFKFNQLNFSYASGQTQPTELQAINILLHSFNGVPFYTPQPALRSQQAPTINYPKGFSLQGALILGENAESIPLHTQFSGGPGQSGSASKAPAKPSHLGKQYGPIILDSVSLASRDGGVGLKFTGGLMIGPVTFELINFEITSPLDHFDPDISIDGLGLDVKKGALNLEGLMLKDHFQIPDKNGKPEEVDGFSGELVIDYKQYSLAALGSYAQLKDGTPSLFLYAFLGTPLGGPPIFFVTGVAAGFGYNRTLELPSPTGISTFPLIEPVMGTPPAGSLATEFDAMNMDFKPKEGAFWGAIGVRGESFKMVQSFILLDVQFNDHIEVDIIGISNMTFPTPKEEGSQGNNNTHPLAKIIIGIIARYLPEKGILTIKGAFQPGTYVLNPNAHITGSFGMLSVFATQTDGFYKDAREGEFVLSIGGYPAHFPVKSYYPQPQRIRLNWQVNPILSVKASGYFAIVPDAMLAGGVFEALYRIGGFLSISASFTLAADFKIFWKPYHYTAQISLSIDVQASFNIPLVFFTLHFPFNMEFGANLDIWGPPFAGKGQVFVHAVVTFTVDVSFGNASPALPAIDWEEFQTSFLPEPHKMLTASVTDGLISTTDDMHIVNPKEISIECHTGFPLTSIAYGNTSNPCKSDFGIAPMGLLSDLKSELTISIKQNGEDVTKDFSYTELSRDLPAALWELGTGANTPEKTYGKGLVTDLVCGVKIIATGQPSSNNTSSIGGIPPDLLELPAARSFDDFDYANFSSGIIKSL
ncbi:MAG: DUF6603 domain-containing protein [Cytophagales bacterium]|nr:DUF6603 domain-containing protein [Cytophagales bacterium]